MSDSCGIVFTFPGQGSYDRDLLMALYRGHVRLREDFARADALCRRFFGQPFLPLVTSADDKEHDARLEACPALDQVGIYLSAVHVARLLRESGIEPALCLGHSFGDLAALTTAGVFDVAAGLAIVCQRVRCLQLAPTDGRMAAVSCSAERAAALLAEARREGDRGGGSRGEGLAAVEIAVLNHPRQTVLSGPGAALETLGVRLAASGVMLTLLGSRFPFHSSHLEAAVEPFEISLRGHELVPPKLPVFLSPQALELLPRAGDVAAADLDLAGLLASQLTTRLDFRGLAGRVLERGYDGFVECSSRSLVGRILRRVAAEGAEPPTIAAAAPSLAEGLGSVAARLEEARRTGVRRRVRGLLDEALGSLGDHADEVEVRALLVAASEKLDRSRTVARPVTKDEAESTPRPAAAADSELESSTGERIAADEAGRASIEPVAVVAMGCVLPGGALDPETFWRNVKTGTSGIVDLLEIDPSARDFVVLPDDPEAIRPVPDKSYTMLNGAVLDPAYDERLLAGLVEPSAFATWTRGQRMLALTLGQVFAGLGRRPETPKRVRCLLGATADGSAEYDDALFLDSALHALDEVFPTGDGSDELRQRATEQLEQLIGHRAGAAESLRQHRLYQQVVDSFVAGGTATQVTDSACSSSLYALHLGIRSLQARDVDLVLAGGVFAPGAANNALFAQFRGLTPHGSRPLDARADGVVFGDGAACVALRRLDDAIAGGDRILGVVRGVGLSSDGKTPSINVPRAAGQSLAIRRAYRSSGVAPETIQYIEAHATSTPVGDAEEVKSLIKVFSEAPSRGAIELASVKALIGHTGWVSGVASLIKVLEALRHGIMPRQYCYDSPNPGFDLTGSPFVITGAERAWPASQEGLPRRAGINGFGFGGTNAHLVVESYEPTFHRHLTAAWRDAIRRRPEAPSRLAVVAASSLFPSADDEAAGATLAAALPSASRRFERRRLHLPKKKILLPDVAEHMDASQFLAPLAAEAVFDSRPELLERWRGETAVVFGLSSKTERGVAANERIFIDRLERRRRESANGSQPDAADEALWVRLVERLRERNLESGPYTLPGLMPNVAASRISGLFDLNGPNMVIDCGDASFARALAAGADLVRFGDCRVALVGGANALGRAGREDHEAAVLLALTTEEAAAEAGLPVLAQIELSPRVSTLDANANAGTANVGAKPHGAKPHGADYRGVTGVAELASALDQLANGAPVVNVRIPGIGIALTLPEPGAPALAPAAVAGDDDTSRGPGPVRPIIAASSASSPPAGKSPGAYDYVRGTPIFAYTPRLEALPATASPWRLASGKILLLIDQPELHARLEDAGVLAGLDIRLAMPVREKARQLAGTLPPDTLFLNLGSDDALRAALAPVVPEDYAAVVALSDFSGIAADTLLGVEHEARRRMLDALFAVARRFYGHLDSGACRLAVIGLGAVDGGAAASGAAISPHMALLSGLVKSLARELPAARCVSLALTGDNLRRAFEQLEIELGESGDAEIAWLEERRHVVSLAAVERMSGQASPRLDSESVVLATGGGRGVTAVLAAELLERFGCTVVALGRSDPAALPEALRALSSKEFEAHESDFYSQELARDRSQKIGELRRRYDRYRSIHELCRNTELLTGLPGRFVYRVVDINDQAAVDALVSDVVREHGRLDLVVHGAGVQVSQALPKKSLDTFRRVVGTKLSSLAHIHAACGCHLPSRAVDFHLLTSAFSYLGNDGQPDYGAANEAMNRLAEAMNRVPEAGRWSSLAWLGWAGIGMTRGSEFAALAANRRLRGVTAEEGRRIFGELLAGPPTAVANVLLADGEIAFYGPRLAESPATATAPATATPVAGTIAARRNGTVPSGTARVGTQRRVPLELNLGRLPYLHHHIVRGVPTLPGAFLISLAARAAHELCPQLEIVAFEDTSFRRFVRVYDGRPTQLSLDSRVVRQEGAETLVQVRVLSDFVHKSGAVLQEDVVLTEIFVRMAPELPSSGDRPQLHPAGETGLRLPDPYVLPASPVQLAGQFNSLRALNLVNGHRFADYQLERGGYPQADLAFMLPNVILVDAFWRFGTVQPTGARALSVYVPERCDAMRVFFDYTDYENASLHGAFTFSGHNPRPEGDLLHVGPIEARDSAGRLMLTVEGGLCRRFGEIEDAF